MMAHSARPVLCCSVFWLATTGFATRSEAQWYYPPTYYAQPVQTSYYAPQAATYYYAPQTFYYATQPTYATAWQQVPVTSYRPAVNAAPWTGYQSSYYAPGPWQPQAQQVTANLPILPSGPGAVPYYSPNLTSQVAPGTTYSAPQTVPNYGQSAESTEIRSLRNEVRFLQRDFEDLSVRVERQLSRTRRGTAE
jgi:hypothetical protein